MGSKINVVKLAYRLGQINYELSGIHTLLEKFYSQISFEDEKLGNDFKKIIYAFENIDHFDDVEDFIFHVSDEE